MKKSISIRLSETTLSQLEQLKNKFNNYAEMETSTPLSRTDIIEEAVAQYFAIHIDSLNLNIYSRKVTREAKRLINENTVHQDLILKQCLDLIEENNAILKAHFKPAKKKIEPYLDEDGIKII